MKTLLRTLCAVLLASLQATLPVRAADQPGPSAESLENTEGERLAGRLEGSVSSGFRFVVRVGDATALGPGMTVRFSGKEPTSASGAPPFRLDLGRGQRLFGRLAGMNGEIARLAGVVGDAPVSVARSGISAVIQRPGESVAFQDGFEAVDEARWTIIGAPEVVDDPKVAGAHALRITPDGASLTHRIAEPFGSGRLEVAFHDRGVVSTGRNWFADLTFRGRNGPETIRVVLGWSEESLAVESPGGPALAVQRLARKPGWHRLTVRFGPDVSEVGVDGNELAHGKGLSGPLVELRLAGTSIGKADAGALPFGHLDDLRLVKFAEPVGGLETDATQDEVRLISGDQLFGAVEAADAEKVALKLDGKKVDLSWGEVSGLYFRRDASAGALVTGLLVRAEWRAAPGSDQRDLNVVEGALTRLTANDLTVATPYAGALEVPRIRLTSLVVLGRGTRIVLDSKAHHLGDEVSNSAPLLDPPQPEGPVLERSFELKEVPAGAAFLVLDVVQVVGEAPELPFASLVKKGELRTNLKLNGEPFDYLNRFINSRNETPEQVRIPIPRALIHLGKNVVRLEQTGTAGDPNFLDDLGVLGVAVEFVPSPGGR